MGDQRRHGEGQSNALGAAAARFGLRRFVARNRGLEIVYRFLVAILGFAIIVTGVVLIPLPGPGWLIVFAGLALLSTEFEWAGRLLHYARDRVHAWTRWVTHQSIAVRGLIGLVGLGFVAGAVLLYADVVGVPSWLTGSG